MSSGSRSAPKTEKKAKERRNKKRLSISTRLFISVAALILLFVVLIVVIDSRFLNVFYIFRAVWDSWDLGETVIEYYDNGKGDYYERLKGLENEQNISIEIIQGDDERLLYSTDYKGEYPVPETGDIDQALIRHYEVISTAKLVASENSENTYIEIQRDNNTSGQPQYLVIVTKPSEDITINIYKAKNPLDQSSEIAGQFLLYMALAALIISLIVVRMFSLRFTRPIKDISAVTEKLARLDFSEKCPPSSTREIARLGESINSMADALDEALIDLQNKNKKLQDDIEKERETERLRTGFISSVSHELKTPIAIIQGYAEGLKCFMDTDAEMARQYSEVIIEETARMHDLVMKLLEIIKYDSGDYKLNYEQFGIHEIVDDWFIRNRQILDSKGITCINETDPAAVCRGDGILISSVVNNYMSNAVSHIGGEKILRATSEDLGDCYRIGVFNSGEHIRDIDIDKIWNSFYRADKSMSRAEGRFGLGLTIVASIQNLHNYGYGVENVEGGVRFWFDVEKWRETESPAPEDGSGPTRPL